MAKTQNSLDKVPHFIDLFLFANSTKKIKRSGWMREKIDDSESLAEHIFSLSFLALQLGTELSERLQYPLNKGKLVKMALIHDIGELETGDIVEDFALSAPSGDVAIASDELAVLGTVSFSIL